MLDPPAGEADPTPMPGWSASSTSGASSVGNDIVLDASGIGQLLGTDASVPVAAQPYPPHRDHRRLPVMTAFPLARSVRPVEGGAGGHTAQPFVQTSAQSWAETDLKDLSPTGKVEFNAEAGRQAGPISLGAAVSAPATDAPPRCRPMPGDAPEPPSPSRRGRASAIPTSPPTTGSASRATATSS